MPADPIGSSFPFRPRLLRVGLALALALSPLVVFHPIVFSGYTLSQAVPAVAPGAPYGGSETIPVLDPGAAASQDESWLVLVRRLMAQGEPPLVNLHNGLGAPLLESLQPGAFYLGNPLLFLFDPASPALFDGFSLLHASLFLVGLFVLALLYARPSIACAAALAVGLTGVTYQHLDMVHYRSVAWLPLALAAAVRIARGEAGRPTLVLFVVAHVAALTAGALQEAFVSSAALGCVFALELLAAPATARARLARLGTLALAAASSSLIGLVSIVPYLKARALGDVFTAAAPERSTQGLAPDGLPTLLVPHVNGFWPYMVRDAPGTWITDFSASGCLFVLVAIVCALARRRSPGFPRLVAAGVAALCALTLLKVQHFAWLDFVRHVPFLNEIRFVKYHYFLFVLFLILAAIGLEALARADARARRRIVLASAALLLACLLPVAWLYASGRWRFPDAPAAVLAEARWSYGGTGVALAASVALLLALPRGAFAWLALVMLALGVCVRPDGWLVRSDVYRTPPEALLPADDADDGPRRWASGTPPNQNAIAGFESVWTFDPISNSRLRELMAEHLTLANPWFHLQAVHEPRGLTRQQVDWLRFLGVTHPQSYHLRPAAASTVVQLEPRLHRVEGELPRVLLLEPAAAAAISDAFDERPIRSTLDALHAALATSPAVDDVAVGARDVTFRVDRAFEGTLVATQAFSHGWTFEGGTGTVFCRLYPAWPARLEPGRAYRIVFRPPGLTAALVTGAAGLVVLALTLVVAGRLRAASVALR